MAVKIIIAMIGLMFFSANIVDAKQKIDGFRGIKFGEEFSEKSEQFYYMFSPQSSTNSKVYTC